MPKVRIGCPLLLAAILCLAGACSSPNDDPVAIKRAAAKSETPMRKRIDYSMSTFLGDYLRVGRRNPAWDGVVTNGLSVLARGRISADRTEMKNASTDVLEAIRLGCDDPLILA
jgi:hypothetical protein